MAHELPIINSCTKGLIWCYWNWADSVTLGFWSVAALLSFVVVLFMATSRFGSHRAFGYSSFVGMIGAIFLATMQLMSWWIATIFIFVGVAGLAMMAISERR